MEHVIETEGLSCRYGRVEAVRDVTVHVPAGSIFALLGPNGAGKTTTVKMLMNLVRPKGGRARVLGVDSTRLGPATLASIGYVSENQQLPEWMRVSELEAFCKPLYPTWDDGLAAQLRTELDLDPRARIRHLSRGMKVKAALLVSLAYRPRLLILDEPFTGLDPAVRDDLVRGVLRLVEQDDWTVFLSSHDMDEVERLADRMAFLEKGRIQITEEIAALLNRFRRVEVTLSDEARTPDSRPPSWLGFEVAGRAARFVESDYEEGRSDARLRELFPGAEAQIHRMTLREIFVVLARRDGPMSPAIEQVRA